MSKNRIFIVELVAGDTPPSWRGSNILKIYRTGNGVSKYPMTERNYWRAVGMQLRLAGFTPKRCACGHSVHDHLGGEKHCFFCGCQGVWEHDDTDIAPLATGDGVPEYVTIVKASQPTYWYATDGFIGDGFEVCGVDKNGDYLVWEGNRLCTIKKEDAAPPTT